ncbi:hypothetical protein, partial [Anaerosporobacter sp.]
MNFNKKVLKISSLCVAGTVIVAVSTAGLSAVSYTSEEPVAGISVSLNDYYTSKSSANEIAFAGALADNISPDVVQNQDDSEDAKVDDAT